jgi:hypothetical protein
MLRGEVGEVEPRADATQENIARVHRGEWFEARSPRALESWTCKKIVNRRQQPIALG